MILIGHRLMAYKYTTHSMFNDDNNKKRNKRQKEKKEGYIDICILLLSCKTNMVFSLSFELQHFHRNLTLKKFLTEIYAALGNIAV